MRSIKTDSELHHLEQRILHYANDMNMTLPEMRFFILDQMEFASLLEKNVFPASPLNIWEGKRMVNKKFRIESGQESSLYYEVVQTGDPSYAYLNETNSAMMQASVMAHVAGHCEFSELNVLKDSNKDRTEYILHLVRKVNLGKQQMGEKQYIRYWNACESAVPLIAPHSRFNMERSVENEFHPRTETRTTGEGKEKNYFMPHSHTLDELLQTVDKEEAWKLELKKKSRQEQLSRKGYRLRAPCQDILGFLRDYAPASTGERAVLKYLYFSHANHDFVIRTQIMNEGWAMYWEKKIMLELFKEEAVKGIIDYAKVFSGVCRPRPYFMRNPYHLGYNLWTHIEMLYRDGKINLEFLEETDSRKKEDWKKGDEATDPIECMRHLVKTITDYEFIRRFLTFDLVTELHLNRIPKQQAKQMQIQPDSVVKEDERWVWLNPKQVKYEMLRFFSHFFRPRIFLIDTDFQDGGLLLYHLYDQRDLRKDWILPTLKNLNYIWKGPVSLISGSSLYTFSASHFQDISILEVPFETIVERMRKSEKPFKP